MVNMMFPIGSCDKNFLTGDEMAKLGFSETDKAKIFDKIAENYFNRNFGSMSKSDFETLLFSEYIEQCIKKKVPYDDYTLSKELGITQNRIRTLKEKKELKYPQPDFSWKEAFVSNIPDAKYDEDSKRVKMVIQDVNVLIEVRHFLEDLGWYDEYQLNKKILQVPLNCFVDICANLNDQNENIFTEESKKKINEFKYEGSDKKAITDFVRDFTRDGLKKFAVSASVELLTGVLGCIPFGGVAKTLVDGFTKILIKK